MIDTDKYTGHTPAPWSFKGYQNLELANETHSVVELHYDPRLRIGGVIDMQLIADAPLLLAEVKRLQERVKDLEYEVENWKGELSVRMHPIDYDALVNGGEEE